jgi:hypothetical protein
MNQRFRIIIVVILLLSVLLLAGNQVAWAGKPSNQVSQVDNNQQQSIVADRDDNNEDGTVKPPPKEIVITKSGTYSVGGFCTITITLNSPDVMAVVHIERPLPRGLPDNFQRIRQGCHVTYYQSGKRLNELTPNLGSTTICFAAIPKKQMKLYFYNIHSKKPTWSPLKTTVNDGVACGAGNSSGIYVGTYKGR